MGTIATLLGGILGFVTALTGFAIFGLSLLQCLALWSASGLLAASALVLLAWLPHLQPEHHGVVPAPHS